MAHRTIDAATPPTHSPRRPAAGGLARRALDASPACGGRAFLLRRRVRARLAARPEAQSAGNPPEPAAAGNSLQASGNSVQPRAFKEHRFSDVGPQASARSAALSNLKSQISNPPASYHLSPTTSDVSSDHPSAAAEPCSSPPPCFFWTSCHRHAALEKQGKSVCAECAEALKGTAYPLRPPSRAPLYWSGFAAAEAMDMIETDHKFLNFFDHTGRRPSATALLLRVLMM